MRLAVGQVSWSSIANFGSRSENSASLLGRKIPRWVWPRGRSIEPSNSLRLGALPTRQSLRCSMSQRWPGRLWIVRHGESAGNVARDAAMASGATHIDIAERDVDVPLSKLGEDQAQAVGRWFAAMSASERPEVVFTSPYARAVGTAGLMQGQGGFADAIDLNVDERLREK